MSKVVGKCSRKHMPPSNRARVFIAHSFSNKSQVALIRNLKNDGHLKFIDYSVKNKYDRKWKTGAHYRIRESTTTIFAINSNHIGKGMMTELKMAKKMEKPILVVKNKPDLRVPSEFKDAGAKIIPFDCRKIQKEIDSNNHRANEGIKRRHWRR